jgi:hypothetical protein
MKNILLTTLSVISILSFGCAKGSDNSGQQQQQQQQTVTTMTTDCVNNPQLCNTSAYNNTYGYQPYNNYNSGGYFYNNGVYGTGSGPGYYNANGNSLCNCPQGTVPTYNTFAGMGCVNSGMVGGGYGYAYFGYGYGGGANNNQWTNIPQVSNYVGYNSQSCYNGVVQSCLTDQQNMCSGGYTCRASSAGSRLGLCVSNSGTSSGQVFR